MIRSSMKSNYLVVLVILILLGISRHGQKTRLKESKTIVIKRKSLTNTIIIIVIIIIVIVVIIIIIIIIIIIVNIITINI